MKTSKPKPQHNRRTNRWMQRSTASGRYMASRPSLGDARDHALATYRPDGKARAALAQQFMAEVDELAARITAAWQGNPSAAESIQEQRREL